MATLAHNLKVRMDSIRKCWVGVTIYWLGDAAHLATHSDHNPDSVGVVHAIDVMFPVGTKATAVLDWCLSHPDDLEYVIHNRKIYERSNGFKPKAYTGSDPHTNHVHISGRHGTQHTNNHTGVGYNLTAEKMSPTGSPCAAHIPIPSYPLGAYPGHELKLGSNESAVKHLQTKLNLNGYPLVADGDYGAKTVAAVKTFQSKSHLLSDGVTGPITWAAVAKLPK